jgi:thiopeptide-type bacteriocin biosynthesis protein
MGLRVLPTILLRAPLLPAPAAPGDLVRGAGERLLAHPLGQAALDVASPDLAAALGRGGASPGSLGRYGRRAAFRPTPSGLLAGVALGRLGAATELATGEPRAHLRPSWARLRGLARALLDEPECRARIRLRIAPSLVLDGPRAAWLRLRDEALAVEDAQVDDALAAVVSAARGWARWPKVRRALAQATGLPAGPEGRDTLDDLLLGFVDAGLLETDLSPPLVVASPEGHLRRRLAALGGRVAREVLRAWPTGRGDVVTLRRRLAALPGAGHPSLPELHGVLTFRPAAATVERAVVERAAGLAPFLFRMQEALARPVRERDLQPDLLDRLRTCAERHGAGAFDLQALGGGAYGERLTELPEGPRPAAGDQWVVAALTEALLATVEAGSAVLELDREHLEPLLPSLAPLPSFELFLAPTPVRGEAPGTGWLLGLHAPAGASWGRFAEALGRAGQRALEALAAAERAAYPGWTFTDVSFAPSVALADLVVHPPVRKAALAVTGWPDGAVAVRELQVALDEEGPLGLRVRRAGDVLPLLPSPLTRVRSTTAPSGLYRWLVGWSLARQHAPWAFVWGPLAGLPRLPRVVLDDFVVAPASWRVPALGSPGELREWRARAGVPRFVQVGEGDELLPLDLEHEEALGELRRGSRKRVWEIWPPLGPEHTIDRHGRRVEILALVVREPEDDTEDRLAARLVDAGQVSPAPAEGWITLALFSPEDRQDELLLDVVARHLSTKPRVRWFFQRYRAHGRPHLRVRISGAEGLAQRLAAEAQRHGATSVETAPYFPETARYGGPACIGSAEAIFEAQSRLVLETLALTREQELEGDRVELAVRAADGLVRGFGLDLGARHALAARLREAYDAEGLDGDAGLRDDARLGEQRRRGRRLAGLIAGAERDAVSPQLASFIRAVRAALPRGAARRRLAAALPALVHVGHVRCLGADRDAEALAIFLWERTLAGLDARARHVRAPTAPLG